MIVVARIPFQRIVAVYRLGLAVYDLPLRSDLRLLEDRVAHGHDALATVVSV